ncbi:hypothetical protein KI387_035149, partial [Taxus chinensis]
KNKGKDSLEGIIDALCNLKRGVQNASESYGSMERNFVNWEARILHAESIVDTILMVNNNLIQKLKECHHKIEDQNRRIGGIHANFVMQEQMVSLLQDQMAKVDNKPNMKLALSSFDSDDSSDSKMDGDSDSEPKPR